MERGRAFPRRILSRPASRGRRSSQSRRYSQATSRAFPHPAAYGQEHFSSVVAAVSPGDIMSGAARYCQARSSPRGTTIAIRRRGFERYDSPFFLQSMRARRATLLFAGAMLLAVVAGCAGPGSAAGRQQPREVWGFTAFWDTLSRKSAARNGASLDGLVTTWIALDTAGRLPAVLFVDSSRAPRVPERRPAPLPPPPPPPFRP